MSGLLGVERVGRVAHVSGDACWADVEAALTEEALTLGPVPSGLFARSVADTFASNDRLRPSPRYGQLTDAALAVRAALPDGRLTRSTVAPRRATGPDLARSILGNPAAGRLMDVHLQAWRLPAERVFRARTFGGWAPAMAGAARILRAGVAPAWWRLDRHGRRIRLLVCLVGGASEAERFDAVDEGRLISADDAAALHAERFPTPCAAAATEPLVALRACVRAGLGAAVRGLKGVEVWDLRPEGATVYGRGEPLRTGGWDDLTAAFNAALAEVG